MVSKEDLTRRKVLRTSAFVAGSGILSTASAGGAFAKLDAAKAGQIGKPIKKVVSDAKVVYEVLEDDEDIPLSTMCQIHLKTDVQNDRLFRIELPHTNIVSDGNEKELFFRSPNIQTAIDSIEYEPEAIYLSDEITGSQIILSSDEQIKHPRFELTNNGQMIQISVENGRTRTVPPNQRKEFKLPKKQIHIPEYGEIEERTFTRNGQVHTRKNRVQTGTRPLTIRPKIRVINHGELKIFSSPKGIIGPPDSSWMRSRMVNAQRKGKSIKKIPGTDLVFIEEGQQ